MSRVHLALAASSLLMLASAGGCALISGLSEYQVGAGGAGGGAQGTCKKGDMVACYTGPPSTEGTAPCTAGTKACSDDGSHFGDCIGEILPAGEDDCDKLIDTTCDGKVTCACKPGATKPCYTGLAKTEGVGSCVGGLLTCNAEGTAWGACEGEVVPKPEQCDATGDENCDGIRCSESFMGSILNGTLSDMSSRVDSVAVDGTGSIYLTGILEGALDLGNSVMLDGSPSPFLLKLSPKGVPQWAYQFPPNVSKLLVTIGASNAVIVAGEFTDMLSFPSVSMLLSSAGSTDIFVTKFNLTGTLLDASSFGGVGTESLSALTMKNLLPLVGGEFSGGPITVKLKTVGPPTGVDVFLAEIDSTGHPDNIWSFGDTMSGPTETQTVAALAVDSIGNVFLGLNFYGGVRLGLVDYPEIGGGDFAIAKLDKITLGPIWSQAFGSQMPQSLTALRVDGDDAVVAVFNTAGKMNIGGNSLGGSGSSGACAAKFDLNGNVKWSTSFPGSSATVEALAVDSSGDVVLAGSVYGHVTFGAGLDLAAVMGSEVFLAKLDNDGAYKWSTLVGGPGMQNTPRLAVESNLNLALAFFNQGTANLESGALTSNGGGSMDSIVVSRVFP